MIGLICLGIGNISHPKGSHQNHETRLYGIRDVFGKNTVGK